MARNLSYRLPYSPKKPVEGAVVTPAPWYASLIPYRLRRRRDFVILSHPRSGSNFLRHGLNSHPEVREFGEPFHPNPLVSVHPKRILGKDQLGEEDVDNLMDAMAWEKRVVAPGFSLFSRGNGHLLDHDAAARLAARPDFHVIFLIRRNLLKAYVSHRRALRTGYYHVDPTGRPIDYEHSRPVTDAKQQPLGAIDTAEAKEWIEETQAFFACTESAVRSSRKGCHKVYYEDLCLRGLARSLHEVNGVLDFLGLRALKAFQPKFGRTADKDFYQSIPNREEVARALGFDLDWQ